MLNIEEYNQYIENQKLKFISDIYHDSTKKIDEYVQRMEEERERMIQNYVDEMENKKIRYKEQYDKRNK